MALHRAVTLLCCLMLFGRAGAVNPGAVARITQKGLDYACQIGIDVLQQKLSTIQLPEYPGTYDVGILGTVHYDVFSMAITSVQLPSSQISLVPNVGLKVSIDQAFIAIHGRWKVKYLFVSDSGEFDLKVQGISISVGLSLGSDESGRPTVSTSDCSAHIANMQVHFTNTIDWLINLFDDAISSALRDAIQSQMCPEVITAVQTQLTPVLQSLPITENIDLVAAIDYSLTGPPSVATSFLDANMKGEVFELSHRTTPPFPPQPLSLPDDHNLMIYIAISDYFFNTAGLVYQSAGKLVFNVTNDMLLGNLLGNLKTYPNSLVKLMLTSPSAPSLNISSGNVRLTPVVDVQAYAILPNSSLAPLFLLKLTADFFVKVTINSNRIVGILEANSVHLELQHSDIGNFSVTTIEAAFNALLKSIVVPNVNEILKQGYPLPLLEHIQLENVILKQYEHYLLLGADVHYE